MKHKFWGYLILIVLIVLAAIIVILASCTGNSVEYQNEFEYYGRVIYCPPIYLLADSSRAEFYLFTRGQTIWDAIIIIGGDTIPLADSSTGLYTRTLPLAMGDSLDYSITSTYGTTSGTVIIPDTVAIAYPQDNTTYIFGEDIQCIWRSSYTADGYFVYLENQSGYMNDVTEMQSDTSLILRGENMYRLGQDRIWIESLKGDFIKLQAPNNRILPRGVVGAAANVHNIYISAAQK